MHLRMQVLQSLPRWVITTFYYVSATFAFMENSKFNIVVTTAIYSHYIGQYNYLEILTTAI